MFSKHWNVCCRICPAQHGNSDTTNSVSLGRGYVFNRPIADREESSENLFEKKQVFGMEMTLLLKVLSRREMSISALKCQKSFERHTIRQLNSFASLISETLRLCTQLSTKWAREKRELELMHVYVLISIWSLKRFPRVCEAREARLNTDRFATEGGVEVGRGSEEGCWGCVWGDGIKAHQLHDLVKEDQRLERELHADSKVGEGLSDWDCKICQRHNHKAAKK